MGAEKDEAAEWGVRGFGQGVPDAVEQIFVLAWLTSEPLFESVNGLPRIHASIPGNAVAYCSLLGRASDRRVKALVDALLETQWPDGGWNCDESPTASCSSVHESLGTLWGLIEYAKVTGDVAVSRAADRAAEFFLERRLFRKRSTGEIVDPEWLRLHYPSYWHYDILQALVILSRADKLSDPRVGDALDVIESKRDDHGLWRPEGYLGLLLGAEAHAGAELPRRITQRCCR